jgi:SAM-dependent methyltransferase
VATFFGDLMTNVERDPTKRFSGKADNYVKYRPSYPPAVLDLLRKEAGLSPASVIADVGSGTGKLSILFLEHGNTVYGVEPNDEMRTAGERLLREHGKFVSVAATAEATGLPDNSVDLVAAGQAFHWFEPVAARREFNRILRPGGFVVLVWNDWGRSSSPANRAYEDLLEDFGLFFHQTKHSNASGEEVVERFFAPGHCRQFHFDNHQEYTLSGIRGRLLSSSYAPPPGHPNYAPMMARLESIYDEFQANGRLRIEYDTTVFLGRLA